MKIAKQLTLVLVILTALTVSGCNNKSNYKALLANEWQLESILHSDSMGQILIPAGITIQFTDSARLSGNAGCNRFFAEYNTLGYNQIAIEAMGSTLMWCLNMPFETSYTQILREVQTYEATDTHLMLMGPDEEFTLTYLPVKRTH